MTFDSARLSMYELSMANADMMMMPNGSGSILPDGISAISGDIQSNEFAALVERYERDMAHLRVEITKLKRFCLTLVHGATPKNTLSSSSKRSRRA